MSTYKGHLLTFFHVLHKYCDSEDVFDFDVLLTRLGGIVIPHQVRERGKYVRRTLGPRGDGGSREE